MKCLLLIYATEADRERCLADHGPDESIQLAHDLNAEGKYLGAAPLQPVSMATSVRVRDGKRLVTDGPFAETHEQLGGYYLVDARDLYDAINIAAHPTGEVGNDRNSTDHGASGTSQPEIMRPRRPFVTGEIPMKVMVLVNASRDSEAGVLPSEQLLRDMGKFNEELVKAGVMLAGEGLKPSSKGVRVRFSGKERNVVDGPFAETKELLAGYWLWQVKSMDEAIAWLKRCPNPMNEDSEVEIRPVFSPEDFAPSDPTGELRAAERQLRTETERRQLGK